MAGEPIERSDATIAAHRTEGQARQKEPASGQAPAVDESLPPEDTLDAQVRAALRAENISGARTLVANAEAVLSSHQATTAPAPADFTVPQIAAAKARIAMAVGDGAAARAILLLAIERHPEAVALRSLMSEVMLADGRATDVRPVLRHLKRNSTKAVSDRPDPSEPHQDPSR